MKIHFLALVKQYMGDYWAWLGITRSATNSSTYVWADGTDYNYNMWTTIPSDADCAHLDAINGEWYHRACNDTHGINGWFCEIDAKF